MPKAGFWLALGLVAGGHLLGRTDGWKRLSVHIPGPVLGAGYATALTLALLLAPPWSKPFIYFQF